MRAITLVIIALTMFELGYKLGQRLEPQEKPCPAIVPDEFNCMALDGGKNWDYKLCYRARPRSKKA